MTIVMCSACRCCSLQPSGKCAGECEVDGHTAETICTECDCTGHMDIEDGDGFLIEIDCAACNGKGFLS